MAFTQEHMCDATRRAGDRDADEMPVRNADNEEACDDQKPDRQAAAARHGAWITHGSASFDRTGRAQGSCDRRAKVALPRLAYVPAAHPKWSCRSTAGRLRRSRIDPSDLGLRARC